MMIADPDDHSRPLDIGDRVIAAERLGGFVRGRVRRGTQGIVIGGTADGRVIVTFGTKFIYTVQRQHLTPLEPPATGHYR
jgi:hypothetical protein